MQITYLSIIVKFIKNLLFPANLEFNSAYLGPYIYGFETAFRPRPVQLLRKIKAYLHTRMDVVITCLKVGV